MLGVYVNTSRYRTKFSKRIRVTTNDPDHAMETLLCKGEFLRAIQVDPPGLNFGQIKPTSPTVNRSLTLMRGDAGPISPELLPFSNPGLEAQICEIEPGERYELEVSFGPPYPAGKIQEVLHLMTGVDEAPQMDIHVRGYVKDR